MNVETFPLPAVVSSSVVTVDMPSTCNPLDVVGGDTITVAALVEDSPVASFAFLVAQAGEVVDQLVGFSRYIGAADVVGGSTFYVWFLGQAV